ncbi:DUF2141 domain-containing protein [Flavobacterium subsaxonicum]|uniref:DUF2141 domain-containing protein n=1 Tax=Flavobacterium subsaxonicum TaxID=426226 RepID=UPI000410B515|nr:DUF2141 domain-containing protein [Flavobacterium subsaxonicum]
MKQSTVIFAAALGVFTTLTPSLLQAQNTKMVVSGIESNQGQIVLNVFKDDTAYENEQPFKTLAFEKTGLANGTITLSFTLEPGTYGITLIDDKNKNGKIDKNMLGIPKEGFGFSNFFMEKMKKPLFDEFKVKINAKENMITAKIKYM